MKKISSVKRPQDEGMALVTVLGVMMILLILSLAIVSLSTGNMKTVGNISARLQALNLANAASMYAVYEIDSCFDPNTHPWAPGRPPTPPAGGLSFVPYDPIPPSNLNGLPGKCRVAYVNNFNNPNTTFATAPGGSFASYVGSTVNIPAEGAVILAQGEYEGFKRTIKVQLKHIYHGSVADGALTLDSGILVLNGIMNMGTLAPCAGSMYSKGGINYNNLSSCKFLNGSKLVTSGLIPPPGSGVTIDPRYLESGSPNVTIVGDWRLDDPNLTAGNPTTGYNKFVYDPNTDPHFSIEDLPGATITRPVFQPTYAPTPEISDDKRYCQDGGWGLGNGVREFVNGSLHVKGNLYLNGDACMFVNGTLTIDGMISNDSSGQLFVAGYYGDPNSTDPNTPYGLSMELKHDPAYQWTYTFGIDPNSGAAIFTEGDIKLANNVVSLSDTAVDAWLAAAPLDMTKVKNEFDMLGLSRVTASEASAWYLTGAVDPNGQLVAVYADGRSVLYGCPTCNQFIMNKGYTHVPPEVGAWFSDSHANKGMSWATDTTSLTNRWETFCKNPSLYQTANDLFLPAVIYTYGDLTTAGSPSPIRIVGGVVSKYKGGVSPNGHGGNVTLTNGSSIVLYTDSFRSGRPVIKPILTLYSWEELY